MGAKWFLQKEDVVEGPLSTDDVQSRLQAGLLKPQQMIWGRGLEAWVRLENWNRDQLHLITSGGDTEPAEQWHFAHEGSAHGPYLKEQLLAELKTVDAVSDVMLWTKGMIEWAPIFEFHDILTALGANKREFPRADVSGKITIKTAESTLIGQLVSVSEGGCGVKIEGGLVPGQIFALEMQSPAFRNPLNAKGECRYVSDGFVGIRFTNVSVEVKSALVQFIKQSQTRFVLKAA